MDEIARQDHVSRKAKVFNAKHNFYRHTRCTSIAQEEASAPPAGVINVNEDSDEPGAYDGEQKETAKEMDELRSVSHLINQEGWNADAEGRAISTATGQNLDLRLDWPDVKRRLESGVEPSMDADPE